MRQTRSAWCAAFAVLLLWSGAFAQQLDLLTGTAGDGPICALTPEGATALFGIPSRNHEREDGFTMDFSHHGLALEFGPEASGEAVLVRATVYAKDRDGFSGHKGHFLGTIASGTHRDPVRRLLRSVTAEIAEDAVDRWLVRVAGFELEIGFVSDLIGYVSLVCSPQDASGGTS